MKKILCFSVLCSGFLSFAQVGNVGINTTNPQTPLHIDGAKDNPVTGVPTTAQQANDVAVTSTGKVGVGRIDPVAKLDLRGSGNVNNSLGVGKTTQTAAQATAGAVRYYPLNGGKMQFSDGVVWYSLNSNTKKVAVIEKVAGNPQIPYNTPTTITSWFEYGDTTDSFSGNTFTAPREGVYLISATYNLDNLIPPFDSDAYADIRFIVNNNTAAPAAKCSRNFGELSATQMQVGVYCVVGLKLAKNDQLYVQINQKINGKTAQLRNDSSASTFGFNNITINEQ